MMAVGGFGNQSCQSGIGVPSYKEQIVLESGLQSPPTREFRRTEEGNLKLYLTFVRK